MHRLVNVMSHNLSTDNSVFENGSCPSTPMTSKQRRIDVEYHLKKYKNEHVKKVYGVLAYITAPV